MLITIYHGSLEKDIINFYPTPHFSYDAEQVKTVLAGKLFLDHKTGQPTLYKCEIDLSPKQIKTVEDIGSPNIPAILFAYCGGRDRQKRDPRFDGRPGIDQPWEESNKYLLALAEKDGIVALEYENAVELGGKSLCVLFPEQVTVISSTPIEMNDIKKAFESCPTFAGTPFDI